MLYVTTRTPGVTYPADTARREDRGPDGGFFVPQVIPKFDGKQIMTLGENTFSCNVASIINLFFDTNLDSWSIEFAIGRYPVNLVDISGRATIAETWHNPAWRFDRLVMGVEKAILQSDQIKQTDWLMIAARIAVLFGVFGTLIHEGSVTCDSPIDVAVASGDFSGVMAIWYAREMGLPIGGIICASNENPAAWNLLHKGELRTEGTPFQTATPACDHVVPADLERLIFHTLGVHENRRFLEVCSRGSNYYLERWQSDQLRDGIQVSVVSNSRMESAISNLYLTSGYIADPYTALIYAGLIDCRSRTGAVKPALIIADESPIFSVGLISRCLGMAPLEVKERINKA